MLLSRRSAQPEYFDSARPLGEVAEFFHSLDRLNSRFAFAEPFQNALPRMLGEAACVSLSILDVGAGNGSLGKALSTWAGTKGWQWRVTNLDVSLSTLGLNRAGMNVAGSALALPFRDGAFDAVVASQMTHHFGDAEVAQILREAWRVSRSAICFCDLHRNLALYIMLWLLFRFQRFPSTFEADALLSVKRSWRVPELQRLGRASGLSEFTVRNYFGARVLLCAAKNSL
jgi:ubiquinone/menaquinone biosynthesis C-methylase UbiE